MKSFRMTLLLTTVASLSFVTCASASTTLTWQHAKKAVLPAGATGLPSGYLPTLTCPSAGNCESGGAYSDASGATHALVLREQKGVWGSPATLRAPSGAATSSNMEIYGLSCASSGNCSAVGSYTDASSNNQAFVDDQVHGIWANAHEVTLPANALVNGQNALVHSVVCPSPGNCSAVGTYQDNNATSSRSLAFVVDEVHGTWHSAAQVVLPTSANFNPFASLNQVACSSTGNCVGVGSYVDVNNVTNALLSVERSGQWSHATIAPPLNASPFAGTSVVEVACVKNTSCTFAGTYNTSIGAIEGFSATLTNGRWSTSVELAMPNDVGTNPHVFLYGYQGIACSSRGDCALGGQYVDAAGKYQGFLANERGGTWGQAVEMALPAGGGSAGQNGGVVALSCPSNGNCRAGAAYMDAQGIYEALLIVEVNGTWHAGTKVILPPGATTVGVDGGIYSVVCVSTSACTAIGSYLEPTTLYQGLTLSS